MPEHQIVRLAWLGLKLAGPLPIFLLTEAGILRETHVIVINGQRTTAIVIRHRGDSVTLVPMKSGRLSAKTLGFAEFRSEWKETGYALSQGLTTFLAHIMKWGASLEVVKGLEKLAARDRFVVASLF
ncbi:MAG: hypothetical protein Q8O52_07840 [Sulfuritalea sp.]|nr:hypothetical protein [Sulfuritalea sp.]